MARKSSTSRSGTMEQQSHKYSCHGAKSQLHTCSAQSNTPSEMQLAQQPQNPPPPMAATEIPTATAEAPTTAREAFVATTETSRLPHQQQSSEGPQRRGTHSHHLGGGAHVTTAHAQLGRPHPRVPSVSLLRPPPATEAAALKRRDSNTIHTSLPASPVICWLRCHHSHP